MGYELSILDQTPVFEGQSNVEAFQQTLALAQMAEKLGYKRFLVSEHHNLEGLAGTSPEVLISHILAKTSKIRVGSAGVMLQHYSAFKVAENFNVLATLAPGRVDLGVGKTSGGLPYSTKALQKNYAQNVSSFQERFIELFNYIYPTENTLIATPVPPTPPKILLLGASVDSAKQAARLDINYAYAYFNQVGDEALAEVANILSKRQKGKFILSVTVFASENSEEAQRLASTYVVAKVSLQNGFVASLQNEELAIAFGEQSEQPYEVKTYPANIIAGTPLEIKQHLDELHAKYGVDEFILHTPIHHVQKRIKSFELLSPASLFQPISQ